MSTPNLSTSCEDNGDTEISSHEISSTGVELEDVSHSDIPSEPLDLRVVINTDLQECTLRSLSPQRKTFLNAPFLKSISKSAIERKPFGLTSPKVENLSNTKSIQMLQSTTLTAPIHQQPMEITPADSTSQESKTKVALKFCLRKCVEISLYFRASSKKVIAPSNCRFHSLCTSLKNTVKNLAKKMPSNVVSQIHNSVMNKIKDRRMQNCLKLFSLKFIPFDKYTKIKGSNSDTALTATPVQSKPNETTFVNPVKKPELQHLAGFKFAKPKFYECSYCDTRFYKLPIYIRHIRRHSQIIKCDTCWKVFSSIINKRRHQLQCRHRNIL